MGKHYRSWTPTQAYLLPPSPLDWLPEDHLVYFLLEVVEELDLSAIEAVYQQKDPRGVQPYHPRMMVCLLLYGYCRGLRSSRKLEQATWEDLPTRVLCGEAHPDHSRIAAFRRTHLKALADLFVQVLRLCQAAGLVKLGEVALDGTKQAAAASKHKAMSHARMLQREAELTAEIDRLLTEAEAADAAEEAAGGAGRGGDELPPELARRVGRKAQIATARARVEAEALAARARELAQQADAAAQQAAEQPSAAASGKAEQLATQAADRLQEARAQAAAAGLPAPELVGGELPAHQMGHRADGRPKPTAQLNFTDPDSRIMKRGSDFIQGYNAQLAVDRAHQVIVGQLVTNQPADVQHLRPLLAQVTRHCGRPPRRTLADSGYWSEDNAAFLAATGTDGYLATERLKHGETPPAPRGRIPQGLDAKGRMRRKLRTAAGRRVYRQRKAIVEPVFGQIREARGIRRFQVRGLPQVQAEWALICLTHNLLKLHRAGGLGLVRQKRAEQRKAPGIWPHRPPIRLRPRPTTMPRRFTRPALPLSATGS